MAAKQQRKDDRPDEGKREQANLGQKEASQERETDSKLSRMGKTSRRSNPKDKDDVPSD